MGYRIWDPLKKSLAHYSASSSISRITNRGYNREMAFYSSNDNSGEYEINYSHQLLTFDPHLITIPQLQTPTIRNFIPSNHPIILDQFQKNYTFISTFFQHIISNFHRQPTAILCRGNWFQINHSIYQFIASITCCFVNNLNQPSQLHQSSLFQMSSIGSSKILSSFHTSIISKPKREIHISFIHFPDKPFNWNDGSKSASIPHPQKKPPISL
jgi:hypothetical protein